MAGPLSWIYLTAGVTVLVFLPHTACESHNCTIPQQVAVLVNKTSVTYEQVRYDPDCGFWKTFFSLVNSRCDVRYVRQSKYHLETVTEWVTREICCPGYTRVNESAECERGCDEGLYGVNCTENCTCPENALASCHQGNGSCTCKPGWKGDNCTEICDNGTYGHGCGEKCRCQNGGLCRSTNGSCFCDFPVVGWTGPFCEQPCNETKHGQDCQFTTDCGENRTTDRFTGECRCKPGYKDLNCTQDCDDWRHGMNCTADCSCNRNNSLTCDKETGSCDCKAGYIGGNCSDECSIRHFGKNCQFECNCTELEYCDHVTGACLCLPGRKGDNCSEVCEPGTFGLNCSGNCSCNDLTTSGPCNGTTGVCDCLPGWTGDSCTAECQAWSHGNQCGLTCNCNQTNTASCDPASGACNCKDGYLGDTCSHACPAWTFGARCINNCTCNTDQSRDCDNVNGSCRCRTGAFGEDCSELTEATFTLPVYILYGVLPGAGGLLVVIVVIIVVVVLCCRKTRPKSTDVDMEAVEVNESPQRAERNSYTAFEKLASENGGVNQSTVAITDASVKARPSVSSSSGSSSRPASFRSTQSIINKPTNEGSEYAMAEEVPDKGDEEYYAEAYTPDIGTGGEPGKEDVEEEHYAEAFAPVTGQMSEESEDDYDVIQRGTAVHQKGQSGQTESEYNRLGEVLAPHGTECGKEDDIHVDPISGEEDEPYNVLENSSRASRKASMVHSTGNSYNTFAQVRKMSLDNCITESDVDGKEEVVAIDSCEDPDPGQPTVYHKLDYQKGNSVGNPSRFVSENIYDKTDAEDDYDVAGFTKPVRKLDKTAYGSVKYTPGNNCGQFEALDVDEDDAISEADDDDMNAGEEGTYEECAVTGPDNEEKEEDPPGTGCVIIAYDVQSTAKSDKRGTVSGSEDELDDDADNEDDDDEDDKTKDIKLKPKSKPSARKQTRSQVYEEFAMPFLSKNTPTMASTREDT